MTAYDTMNIFAKILRGDLPAHKIFEDEHSLAFLDIMPKAKGHALVIPKYEARNILDCPQNILSYLIMTTQKIAQVAQRAFHADGISLIQSNEAAGDQEVFHLHFHVIPRYKNAAMQQRDMGTTPEKLKETAEIYKSAL